MTDREIEMLNALRWALWWIAQRGVVPEAFPDFPTDPHCWENWADARKALKAAEAVEREHYGRLQP